MNQKDKLISDFIVGDLGIPQIVNEHWLDACRTIRSSVPVKAAVHRKKLRLIPILAVCLLLAVGISTMLPISAENAPFVGSLFRYFQERETKAPDLIGRIDEYAHPVEESEGFQTSSDSSGLTISVDEVYCDGNTLMITVSGTTDDPNIKKSDWIGAGPTATEEDLIPFLLNGYEITPAMDFQIMKIQDGHYGNVFSFDLDYYRRFEGLEIPDESVWEVSISRLQMERESDMYWRSDADGCYTWTRRPEPLEGNWYLKIPVKITEDKVKEKYTLNLENNGFLLDSVTKSAGMTIVDFFDPPEYADKTWILVATDENGNMLGLDRAVCVLQEDGYMLESWRISHTDSDVLHIKILDKENQETAAEFTVELTEPD